MWQCLESVNFKFRPYGPEFNLNPSLTGQATAGRKRFPSKQKCRKVSEKHRTNVYLKNKYKIRDDVKKFFSNTKKHILSTCNVYCNIDCTASHIRVNNYE